MGPRAGLSVWKKRKSLTTVENRTKICQPAAATVAKSSYPFYKLNFINLRFVKGADSSVDIMSRSRSWPMGNPSSIPGRVSIKTGYWTKPPSLSMGKRSSFHGRKALGASRTCVYSWSWEWMELYLHSTTFLHGVQWDNFAFSAFHRTMFSAYLILYSARRWIKKLVRSWKNAVIFYSKFKALTLNLLTTTIVAPPSNASK